MWYDFGVKTAKSNKNSNENPDVDINLRLFSEVQKNLLHNSMSVMFCFFSSSIPIDVVLWFW